MKEWNEKKIVKWHKKNMPYATLETQLEKLHEELAELAEYKKPCAGFDEELADVLICCTVLALRFKSYVGVYLFNSLMDPLSDDERELIIEEIRRKMDTNAQRKWVEEKPGCYRHLED